MRFAKIVFLIAGIYGLLVLTPLYFLEGTIGRQTPPAITHPDFFTDSQGWEWHGKFFSWSSRPIPGGIAR
jgi:hypothetical protein